jgi:diaminopimelate epimerase
MAAWRATARGTVEIEFLKMHVAGSDHILVDAARNPQLGEGNLRSVGSAILDRHLGVGGEALVVLERAPDEGIHVRSFTRGGAEEEPTLNELICASRYAIDSGMVSSTTTRAAGSLRSAAMEALDSRSVLAEVGVPRLWDGSGELVEDPAIAYARTLVLDGRDFTYTPLRVGPPQAVAFVPGFDLDIRRLSRGFYRALPRSREEPGTHVADPGELSYVRVSSRSRVSVRTWRFGRGETPSEGYAAAAVAVAAALHGFVDRDTIVSARGGELYVSWSERGNKLYVTGAAEYVFTGSYSVEAR